MSNRNSYTILANERRYFVESNVYIFSHWWRKWFINMNICLFKMIDLLAVIYYFTLVVLYPVW